jgi:hypothetical protein
MLSHLLLLARSRRQATDLGGRDVRDTLNPDLISNIRRSGYTPSPRQLHEISQQLSLTIGGTFKLFGYSLEGLRNLDSVLNGTRTRLIDTYPFYRDRPVDLPIVLGDQPTFRETMLLADIVRSWQRGVPIRSIRGPNWKRQRLLHAQLGTADGMALPTIPPGSIIAIAEIDQNEQRKPDPNRYYFLQHHTGYCCCRCMVDQGRLLLITDGQKVDTSQEFLYPGQVRIVGRVISFATRLPIPESQLIIHRKSQSKAPLVFPCEHLSLSALLSVEKRRFGFTEAHFNDIGGVLEEQLGVRVSARTSRRYERNGKSMPRTAVLLALAAVHSLRPSDVLRLLKLWRPEGQHYSLASLVGVQRLNELPSSFDPPSAPEPETQWQELLEQWGEWPTLLSMTIPRLADRQHGLLRLNPSRRFPSLSPMIRSGSFAVLNEDDISPPRNGSGERDVWNRPIYVVRFQGETLCGYLDGSDTHFALQPHPLAGLPRLRFPRSRAQILGRVVALASPL